VCVHAHPDDEALFTAGATAHYAALGYHVVLVTCTLGQLGLDEQARPGSHPDHNAHYTRAKRAQELLVAGELCGFSRQVQLGYYDSGMKGWASNSDPRAFINADVDAVARVLAALFDEVNADVVLTYDENGFYGHPDHIQANVVTRKALEYATGVKRLYYPILPSRVLAEFVALAEKEQLSLPAWITDASNSVSDDRVATTIDVRNYSSLKQNAIAAHESQSDNADLVTMAPELFELIFGTEYYERAWSSGPVANDELDLFGGM
jgi:LmbE family N-acetylglucosaminyl deacetylase